MDGKVLFGLSEQLSGMPRATIHPYAAALAEGQPPTCSFLARRD
jgi:hypothetical protein